MRVLVHHNLLLLHLLLMCCIACCFWPCDGSSRVHVYQVGFKQPLRPAHNYHHRQQHPTTAGFMGFLPRGIPIPNSAPSRKHNSIGVSSWRPSSTSALGTP
ncbi:unnamed protein product [Rhodiola kirilowii]